MTNLATITQNELADMLLNIVNVIKNTNTRPPRGRGYWLSKIPSKKNGFTYYVRYMHQGIVVPSRWTTGTNDPVEANNWAVINRERLLSSYFGKVTVSDCYDLN